MQKMTLAACLLFLVVLLSGCAGKNGGNARLVNLGNGICQETSNGKMWQIDKSGYAHSREEADAFIAELNRTSGYSDWRLPTVSELYDLNFLFDLHLNGECALERKGAYWSEENTGEGTVGAWEISDQCDPQRRYAPGTKGYVRAVRP